jgi:hypothetical protein
VHRSDAAQAAVARTLATGRKRNLRVWLRESAGTVMRRKIRYNAALLADYFSR